MEKIKYFSVAVLKLDLVNRRNDVAWLNLLFVRLRFSEAVSQINCLGMVTIPCVSTKEI